MDWHEYVTGELIEQSIAERRAQAAVARLVAAHRPPRPPCARRSAVG